MKRILFIAYHFPPLAGSSGIQRTLRFVQHLPSYGWQPAVLTTNVRAYERTGSDLDDAVPQGTLVRRAFALDATRHLSIAGRHLAGMARPDRWASWRFDGVRQGLRLIREFRPDIIFSTYPIATAHVIGSALHRRTGIPWVSDFRDPMAQDGYPADPATWAAFKRIEEDAVRRARLCLFTTPGAMRDYSERYAGAVERFAVLENGYDEEAFVAAERGAAARPRVKDSAPYVLLHSGIVYPSERDPQHLFRALRMLRDRGRLTPADLQVRFRAAVHDDLLRGLAAEHGVADIIELCPPIGYTEALREMLNADALLVMQAANCNAQIPAKIYEYLRSGRPIVALTDPAGDTAGALRAAGVDRIAQLDDAEGIAEFLHHTLNELRAGTPTLADSSSVRQASRRWRTRTLAELLQSALE